MAAETSNGDYAAQQAQVDRAARRAAAPYVGAAKAYDDAMFASGGNGAAQAKANNAEWESTVARAKAAGYLVHD